MDKSTILGATLLEMVGVEKENQKLILLIARSLNAREPQADHRGACLLGLLKEIASDVKGVLPPKAANPVTAAAKELIDLVSVVYRIPPNLPSWFREWKHPDLNKPGDYTSTFSCESLQRFLHDDQKVGIVTGDFLYDYMVGTHLIKGSLALRDLEEIQKKGIAYFRKHFKGLAVFAWASVSTEVDSFRYVPYLIEDGDSVFVRWRCLGNRWNSDSPALRFA